MSKSTAACVVGLFCGCFGFAWGLFTYNISTIGGMQKLLGFTLGWLFIGILIGYMALGKKKDKE